VDRKRCGVWLGAALAVVLVTQEASAQAPPGGGLPPGMKMPTREEIAEKVKQLLAQSPEETIELPGVCKITYKKVPTDPQRVAQLLGQQMGANAAGVDPKMIDEYAKMYQGQITELLNEFLADMGKIEALVELKLKSKRIPVGEHKLGIAFEGERPLALVVFSDAIKKPIAINLKTRQVDPQPELKIEFKTPTNMAAGQEKFDLDLAFMRFQARSKTKLENAATAGGGGGDKEEEEKEEKKERRE
jgi:hypothetical protein